MHPRPAHVLPTASILTIALLVATACRDTGAGPSAAGGASLVLTFASAAVASADRATIHVEGGPTAIAPTTAQAGQTITIPGLLPGTYTVAAEGFRGTDVEWFDQVVVQVAAGATSEARLTVRSFVPAVRSLPPEVLLGEEFVVEWDAVARADAYQVEQSTPDDPTRFFPLGDPVPATSARFHREEPGVHRYRVRAVNRFGSSSLASPEDVRTRVLAPVVIDRKPLPHPIHTRPYRARPTRSGGGAEAVWSLASGRLPDGLSLSSDGRMIGVPTRADTTAATLRVESAGGRLADTLPLTFEVLHADSRLSVTPPSARVGWVGARLELVGLRLDGQGEESGGERLFWQAGPGAAVDAAGLVTATAAGPTFVTVTDSSTSPALEAEFRLDVSTPFDRASVIGFAGNTYVITTGQHTWHEARDMAERYGGRLVVVETDVENSILADRYADRPDLWIGFNDLETEGEYRWVNGSPQTTTPWSFSTGEPSTGPGEDCVTVLRESGGRWADELCTAQRHALVEFAFPQPVAFSQVFAASGVLYATTTGFMDWTSARDVAVALGGHLARIADETENRAVFAGAGPGPWIGLNDRETEGLFTWWGGHPATYTRWASGEPNNQGDEDCVHYSNFGDPEQWNDIECYPVAPDGPRQAVIEFPVPTAAGSAPRRGPAPGVRPGRRPTPNR